MSNTRQVSQVKSTANKKVGKKTADKSNLTLAVNVPSPEVNDKNGSDPSSLTRGEGKQTSADMLVTGADTLNVSEDGFIPVKSRRRRKPVVVGCRSDSVTEHFSGVERKLWLFVGRTSVDTTQEAILSYLKSSFNSDDFTCNRLDARSDYPCFKVSAPFSLKAQLESPDIWPAGVVVRRFNFRGPVSKKPASFLDPTNKSVAKG